MSKKKELMKNTIIIFVGKLSTQFLTFFLLPIYTKYLSSSDYGTIDLILTYITLAVPILSLQFEMGTFRFLIENRENQKKQNQIIKQSILFFLKLALIISIVVLLISFFIKYDKLFLMLLSAISLMFSNLLMQIARGLGKNIQFSISCFLAGTINVFSNIILIIIFKLGGNSILISSFISNFVCAVYLFFSLKIINTFKEKNTENITKLIIGYSWPLVPNTISWWLINSSDRTLITLLINVSANGIYAVSTKFSAIINNFLNIFNLSWTESASLHIDDADRDEFFSSINDIILRLMSSLCILLNAFMPILFNFFIDSRYIDAYKYIPINILASFFNCLVSIYSSIYIAKKMTKKVANTSFLAAFINIIVDLFLIKYIGLYAASISTAVAYIAMTIYRSIDLRKIVKIKYDKKLIFLILITFIINLILYYQKKWYYLVLNIVLSIIYSTYINIEFIIKLKEKIFNKKIKA